MSLTFTQLAADTFVRANENPLGNGNWTTYAFFAQPLQILSNTCEGVAGGFGASQFTGISWPNNQWAEIKLTTLNPNGEVDLVLRVDSGFNNFLQLAIQPGSSRVIVVLSVAGVVTTVGTFGAPSAGDVYRIALVGTTWFVFRNGTQIGSGSAAGVPASGGVLLIVSYDLVPSDTTVNNFAGGSVSGSAGAGGVGRDFQFIYTF